jgi:FMN reductase
MTETPHIVGLGGTVRPASSSERVLGLALQYARELGATTKMYSGRDLIFPIYDPDPSAMTGEGRLFVDELRKADGIILCSPCYHGAVSGLIKNAIDYIEETSKDERVYLAGRSIGAIGIGYGYQGPAAVLAQLRQIGHALRGWNVPLGVSINAAVTKFSDERCLDPGIDTQLKLMARQVVEMARAPIT